MSQTDTQTFENNWIKSYEAGVQQPAANLESTETGIAGAQQGIDIAKQKLDAQNFMTSAQASLDAASKTNGGYAPADLYNSLKGKAAAYGIGDGQFDGAFEQPYTNPNDINYRTTGGRESQQSLGQITRQIEDKLDKYNALPSDQKGPLSLTGRVAELPFIGSTLGQFVSPEATVYQGERTALAAQLKSLVGAGTGSGVRVTEQQLEGWSSLLPEATDSDEVAQGKIAALDKDIKATFNSKTGLDPKYLPKDQSETASNQGGDVNTYSSLVNNFTGNADLDKILATAISNAPSDAAGIVEGTGDTAMNFLGKLTKEPLANAIGDTAIPMGKSYVDTLANILGVKTANGQPILDPNKSVFDKGGVNIPNAGDPNAALDFITKHPVTTVLSALPFLDGGFEEPPTEGATPETTGANPQNWTTNNTGETFKAGETPTENPSTPNAPSKLQQLLNSDAAKRVVGQIRDAKIDAGQEAGNVASGDQVAKDWENWGNTAKGGNMSDAGAIEEAVTNAKKFYGGKTFTPQQLYDSYKEIEDGFTAKGERKSSTSAYIDRASQRILQKNIEDVAPGFKDSTDLFHKIYDTEKSGMGRAAKSLPGNIARGAINASGLGIVGELLLGLIQKKE
jgi:hypothetical protein